MSDDVTYESGYGGTQPGDDRLRETIAELTETIRDAARRTAALDARIDSLPGPMEIASAVESEVERSVREARDVIDARVGSLGADLESLSRRLAEVSEALVPLEGLRTEIATVADESASFRDTRTLLQTALEQLSGGQLPTVAGDVIGAEVDARLEQFRRVLEEATTSIRSDFEMLVGAEQEASERRNDALGLRITNLSVGVTKTLEDLTAQSERMGDRARAIEAENAAILQAIRNEIAGSSAAPREEVRDETGPKVLSALQDVGARLGAVEARVAQRVEPVDTAGPALVALDEMVAKLGTMESRIAERLASLESRVGERAADPAVEDLRGQLSALSGVHPALEEMRTRLSELARIEPTLDDVGAQLAALAHGDPSLADVRAGLSEIARLEPALSDIRAQLRELARVQPTEADKEASKALMSSTVEQLRATLDGAVAAMERSVEQSLNQTKGRLDAVEAAVARAVVDTSDALDGAAAQTATGMQDVRVALGQLVESTSGIERIRLELFQAMESFSTQLVTRTAGVKTSLTDRAGRLEEQISALPSRDDLADTVLQRLTNQMAKADNEREEKLAGLEQELGGVASNVNEIWIRVRSIVKGLEEERAAAREDAEQTALRIEHLALGEDRLAVRLIEAEQRLAESMRALETERDRVFLETMSDLLEKLPRRERKIFRKRVRDIPARRGEPAPPPPPEPAIPPPQRRSVPPPAVEAAALVESLREPARAPEPPHAKAKAKPKPKPKPKAKAKPKAAVRTVEPPKAKSQATQKPSVPPKPKPGVQPTPPSEPKPVAKAEPKPKAKPAVRASKPAARDPKPTEAADVSPSQQPRRSEQPNPPIEQSEANAVVDTQASDETPKKAPTPPVVDEGAEGPSRADSGV